MNIYFIDYENTKLHGLYGIEKLGRFDKVIIFYSENAQSITIDCMKSINDTKAKVTLEHAEIGRHDFLDFQLSSYLGYMVRKHSFADFFIVSADKGYECLESFWKNKGVNVSLFRTSQTKRKSRIPRVSQPRTKKPYLLKLTDRRKQKRQAKRKLPPPHRKKQKYSFPKKAVRRAKKIFRRQQNRRKKINQELRINLRLNRILSQKPSLLPHL